MLHLKELFFLRTQIDGYAYNLSVLELTTDSFILDIFLETTYIIGFDILLCVFAVTRDGNRVEHSHEIGKRLGIAVMRCGRCENQRIALLRKELCKVATQTGIIRNLVTLINHNDIPMRLLQPCTETTIVFQCVYGDDSLVVIVERIFIERYFVLNLGYPNTVKTNKGNGKAVPDFFLELCKDALKGADENALSSAATNHLAEKDANLNSLTKTHTICYQKARTRQFKSLQRRLHLILCYIKCATLCYGNLLREKRIVADGSLDKKPCLTPSWILICHQLGVDRADNLHILVDACIENKVMILHKLAYTDAMQKIVAINIWLYICDKKVLTSDRYSLSCSIICHIFICFLCLY